MPIAIPGYGHVGAFGRLYCYVDSFVLIAVIASKIATLIEIMKAELGMPPAIFNGSIHPGHQDL